MSETVLQEAARIIDGQRTDDYGDPEDSFSTIARYWTTYLNDSRGDDLEADPLLVTAGDVAHMMALLKLARLTTGQPKRDSYVDLAGYAALAARINDVDTVPVESLVPAPAHDVEVLGQQFHDYCKERGTLSTLEDVPVESLPETCHCGQPVYAHPAVENDGRNTFTRGPCKDCDEVRCCLNPRNCDGYHKSNFAKSGTPRIPENVNEVKIGGVVFKRTKETYLGKLWWSESSTLYWTEDDLYKYATDGLMEVEYQ